MSKLIVLAFDRETCADEMREALLRLENEGEAKQRDNFGAEE